MTVTDRLNNVEVHLLPGGGSVGPGPLPLPMPVALSSQPRIADLATLIEVKLSSYLGSPVSRLQDLADVVALIKANNSQRDFALHPEVRPTYVKTWNELEKEVPAE